MRKVGVILIVCLLAVAGITAAMAYTTAEVHNPMSMAVVSTDEALLAMLPGDHAEAAKVENGKLYLSPGQGYASELYGFQPGSKYVFEKIFSVANNAEFDVDAWYELSPGLEALQDRHGPFFQVKMWNPNQSGPEGAVPWSVRWITTIGHGAGNVRHVTFIFDFTDMSVDSYNTFKAMDLTNEYFIVYSEPR